MGEFDKLSSPDKVWKLADIKLRKQLINSFTLIVGIMFLILAIVELFRGTTITGVILLMGSMGIFVNSLIDVRMRTRARWLMILLFAMATSMNLMSGGQLIGVNIALPVLVLMAGLIESARAAVFWSLFSVLQIGVIHLIRDSGMNFPIQPDPAWVQGAIDRVPLVFCIIAGALAVIYRRGITAYSKLLLQTDQQRSEMNTELIEEQQRLLDFTRLAADWYWETDAEHRLIFMSHGFEKMYDMPVEQALGKTPLELYEMFHPLTDAAIEQFDILKQQQPFDGVRMFWRVDADHNMTLENNGKPIFDSTGNFSGYRGIVRNISDAEILRRRLTRQAYIDDLTNIPNRRALFTELQDSIDKAEQLAVCLIDLDEFKQVNDLGGHAAGDALLTEVAALIKNNIREDDLVARLGGDEFCLLLHSKDIATVRQISERILSDLGNYTLDWDGQQFSVGASIGIYFKPDTDSPQTIGEMLKCADKACYEAKSARRHIVVHSASESQSECG